MNITFSIITILVLSTSHKRADGYDNYTGIYTTPLDGVYEFNIQIEANLDTDGDWNFVLDGERVSYTTYQNSEFISMSSTALFHLSEGKQVWVSVAGLDAIWGTNTRMFSWFSVTKIIEID